MKLHTHSVEIVVRGGPGSGKTLVLATVASALHAALPEADMETDISEEIILAYHARRLLHALGGRLHVRLRTETTPKRRRKP